MGRIWETFLRFLKWITARDNMKDKRSNITVAYNTSLPSQHTYLGTDFEEVTGRTVFDDGSYQTLPILTSHDIILAPEQMLPLKLTKPMEISMMKKIIENNRTFGLISYRFAEELLQTSHRVLGTTAEIRSFKEELDNRSGITVLFVKAEGRQRFLVADGQRRSNGILMANVKILPEDEITDPGAVIKLQSLDRHMTGSKQLFEVDEAKRMQMMGNPCNFTNFTRWPSWVYKMYDANLLVEKISTELSRWNNNLERVASCKDPVKFSYWVVANLPLDDSIRLELLSYNSAVQRLRRELSILSKCTIFSCRYCETSLADRHEIFSMSQQGPQGTYVNPDGCVHEMITVYKVRNTVLNGHPSTLYSWFPGYAWTILQCRTCQNHLGWRFTAQDKKLHPDKFWGLCRSSIYASLTSDEEEDLSREGNE